jgi:hypothetical protein
MSEERNERPIYDGMQRRGPDRRRSGRRKSDLLKNVFRYFLVALATAVLVKLLA